MISCRDGVPTFEAKDQGHNFASGLQRKKKVFELEIEVKIKLSLVICLFHQSKNSAVIEPRTEQFGDL